MQVSQIRPYFTFLWNVSVHGVTTQKATILALAAVQTCPPKLMNFTLTVCVQVEEGEEEEAVGVSSSLLTAVKLATPESCCSGPVGPSNLLALDLLRDKTRDAETITGISSNVAEWVMYRILILGTPKGESSWKGEDIIEVGLGERGGIGDAG